MGRALSSRQEREQQTTDYGHNQEMRAVLDEAVALHQAGKAREAIPLYTQVINFSPGNFFVAFNLGIALNSIGELDGAIEYYRQALALEPDHPDVLYFLANAYLAEEAFEEAVGAYRAFLEQAPDHADAHHNLGLAYYQQERLPEAAASFEKALALDSGHHMACYNLGLARFGCEEYEEAVGAFRQAHAICSDDFDICFNLGLTLARLNRPEEALQYYQEALELDPRDKELLNTIGNACKDLHAHEEAIKYYRQALAVDPEYGPAYTNLGIVLHILGRPEEAVACYEKALALGHKPISARYILAALTGGGDEENAPQSYVRELFDGYAERFESSLTGELGYDVPGKLRGLLEAAKDAENEFAAALDLGCGTGLAGEAFRDVVAGELNGVDLSPKMLAKAREKGVYDDLFEGDIVKFLEGKPQGYDLVVAADVLIYLGNLAPFFKAVSGACRPTGLLLFSLENHAAGEDFVLRRSGRFAHAAAYVETLAGQYGFAVKAQQQSAIRMEKEQWIAGNLFCLQRKPDCTAPAAP